MTVGDYMDTNTIIALLEAAGKPTNSGKYLGVYQIRNTLNDKVYIGCSVDLRRRFHKHLRDLRQGTHHSQKLQRAWTKYGEGSFIFEVLQLVGIVPELLPAEQHWLDLLKPHAPQTGYNICSEARLRLGVHTSPETRARMAAAQRGRKLPPEQVEAMRQRMLGVPRSEATRQKIGEASTGRLHSEEAKKKIGAAQKGKVVSEETRQKIREAKKGNNSWAGRKHSEETKEKLRLLKRTAVTDETREQSRQAALAQWAADTDGTLRAKIVAGVTEAHRGKTPPRGLNGQFTGVVDPEDRADAPEDENT